MKRRSWNVDGERFAAVLHVKREHSLNIRYISIAAYHGRVGGELHCKQSTFYSQSRAVWTIKENRTCKRRFIYSIYVVRAAISLRNLNNGQLQLHRDCHGSRAAFGQATLILDAKKGHLLEPIIRAICCRKVVSALLALQFVTSSRCLCFEGFLCSANFFRENREMQAGPNSGTWRQ